MIQRTLILIRHAHSAWRNLQENDFDRPLSERGKHDAHTMSRRLQQRGILPDAILASPAKRTTQTARTIARAVGFDPHHIQWEKQLYLAAPALLETVIYGISPAVHTAFIVAHNPGITELANQLTPDFTLAHLPTCGMVAARFYAHDWNEFARQSKEVLFYDYPPKEDGLE
jgi:phosphohistidine phosphatase